MTSERFVIYIGEKITIANEVTILKLLSSLEGIKKGENPQEFEYWLGRL